MQSLQATLGSRKPLLKHILFGSVTEEVVRLVHCPVVVAKAPAHMAAPPFVHAPSSLGTTRAEDGHAG